MYIQHTLELDERNIMARLLLASLKQQARDPEGADAEYSRVLRMDPTNVAALVNRFLPYTCVAACCSVLQCVAVCCSASKPTLSIRGCYAWIHVTLPPSSTGFFRCHVLQCVAVCCGVLQCVAVCCSVLQCVAVCRNLRKRPSKRSVAVCCYVTLQRTATQCNTLQHNAPHRTTLQHTTTHCTTPHYTATHHNTLLHAAPHHNTPQYTVPHCNTLQHTGTHCLPHTATHCLPHTATDCHTLLHTVTKYKILQHFATH